MQIIRRAAPRRVPLTIPIEPVPYVYKPIKKRVAIWDTETDPFDHGLVVKPFTCGFYFPDTGEYYDFWGDDCIKQFFDFLAANYAEEELLILAHNFGNFDAYFITEYFDAGHKPFIINGRLVRVMAGGQEFRDSYAMMPIPLAAYDKIKFDYDKMQTWEVTCLATRKVMPVREFFKSEILHYQKRDCTALGELVMRWYERFGDRLTMASASLNKLRSYQGFETLPERLDDELRPFYFGGRNQCFATGILSGSFKVYDINSSYPNVMKRYKHPISDTPKYEARITDRTHFAKIRAWSLGALPIRKEDKGLDFPIGTFDFFACIHEIRAGIETGTLQIRHVYYSIYFETEADFAPFVDAGYAMRIEAKSQGDAAGVILEKLNLNSPYGKFAQDPRKYENWLFDPDTIPTPIFCEPCNDRLKKNLNKEPCTACDSGDYSPHGWYLHTTRDGKNIYAQPQKLRSSSFFNVATAASITSAARADLLRGIRAAKRPIYCDTDSIICEDLAPSDTINIHPKELGAWDIEAEGDTVCIAGKKLYAIFKDGAEVKKASKGVKLTASEIERVANGEVVEYASPVPKFKLNGDVEFITRNIKRTG
jgi:hypothetical protein